MSDIARLLLTHLGLGKSIDAACRAAGIPRDEFDHWWQTEITARNPQLSGNGTTALNGDVEIVRDPFGVPHIFASNDNDLFYGFGWAMAQDRLWQLDYLRRKALGRLAEILGKEAIGLAREEACKRYGDLFGEALRKRCSVEGDLAVALSGGMDSRHILL